MLKTVSLAYLTAELDITIKYGKPLPSIAHRELMKEASKIGSVMLIDVMTMKEIYDVLVEKLDEFVLNHKGVEEESDNE